MLCLLLYLSSAHILALPVLVVNRLEVKTKIWVTLEIQNAPCDGLSRSYMDDKLWKVYFFKSSPAVSLFSLWIFVGEYRMNGLHDECMSGIRFNCVQRSLRDDSNPSLEAMFSIVGIIAMVDFCLYNYINLTRWPWIENFLIDFVDCLLLANSEECFWAPDGNRTRNLLM